MWIDLNTHSFVLQRLLSLMHKIATPFIRFTNLQIMIIVHGSVMRCNSFTKHVLLRLIVPTLFHLVLQVVLYFTLSVSDGIQVQSCIGNVVCLTDTEQGV